MVNRMQEGMARLSSRLAERASTSITYSRESTSQAFDAVIGESLLRITGEDGEPQTVRTDRDFLIAAADFLPVFGEPKRGDTVTEVIGSTTAAYEVLPYGDEPGFRYSDEFRTRIRIHTKRTSLVTA